MHEMCQNGGDSVEKVWPEINFFRASAAASFCRSLFFSHTAGFEKPQDGPNQSRATSQFHIAGMSR